MDFTWDDTVTPRQRAMAELAAAKAQFNGLPLDLYGSSVFVRVVTEPACVGHRDYMCTLYSGGLAEIQIRRHADEAAASFNRGLPDPERDVDLFFEESFIHELGHVITFAMLTTDELMEQACQLFFREDTRRQGTLADWNPLDAAHGERIQEAIAEVIKDAALHDDQRIYENRSYWTIGEDDYATLMDLLMPMGAGSGEDWTSDDLYPIGSLDVVDDGGPAGAWFGATSEISAVAPAGAQFGVAQYPSFDFTASECSGGIPGAEYVELIECEAGHAPPGAADNWDDAVDLETVYPLIGGWATVSYNLEQQGFAPVSGEWRWSGPSGFGSYEADPDKDYYIYFFSVHVCGLVGDGITANVDMLGPLDYPIVPGALFGGVGEQVDGPPYPYSDPDGAAAATDLAAAKHVRSRVIGRG